MNLNLEDPTDRRTEDPDDDAASDADGGACGRDDARSARLQRGHTPEGGRPKRGGFGCHGRENREEARLLRLQGLPLGAGRVPKPADRRSPSGSVAGGQQRRDRPEGVSHRDPCLGGNALDPRPGRLRQGRRSHSRRAATRLLRDRRVGPDRSRRGAQVPAHRHARQRLRRRAHDADVGLAARPRRRRHRLLAFRVDNGRPRAAHAGAPPRGADDRRHQLRRLADRRDRRGACSARQRKARRSWARTRPPGSPSSASSMRCSRRSLSATLPPPKRNLARTMDAVREKRSR